MKTRGGPIMGTPNRGSSAVVGPDGRILSASDTPGEKLIIADLDMSQVTKNKTFADASGHCMAITCLFEESPELISVTDARPDMLWLGADPTTKPVIRISKTAP